MAIGYNVVQPNGIVKKQRVESDEERVSAVESLLSRWSDYCNRNWISVNYGDPFCSENKVKLFQNGLAYFLMLGNTGGIVTDYKRIADGKREIPISSCPSYVDDLLYGTGMTLASQNEHEESFRSALDNKDDFVTKTRKSKQKSSNTRYEKIRRIESFIGKSEYFYPIVNTDNEFVFQGKRYRIDNRVAGYNGKNVGSDTLYDMDKIVCAISPDGKRYFFDMNMDLIPNQYIHSVD